MGAKFEYQMVKSTTRGADRSVMFGLHKRALAVLLALVLASAACSSGNDPSTDGGADTPDESAETATGAETPDGAARSDDGDSEDPNTGSDPDDAVAVENNEPIDDGTVLVDTDGVYDDAPIDQVMNLCATANDAEACGQLGQRLASAESLSAEDANTARCVAADLLAGDEAARYSGIIALSLLGGDEADNGVSDALALLRSGSSDEEGYESAVNHVADWAQASCQAPT